MKRLIIIMLCMCILLFSACRSENEVIEVVIPVSDSSAQQASPAATPEAEYPSPDVQTSFEPEITAEPVPEPSCEPTPSSAPQVAFSPSPIPTDEPAAQEAPGLDASAKSEQQSAVVSSSIERDILKLVNKQRSSAGLASFSYSSAMQKAADKRAKECIASFSHTRPDGTSCSTAVTELGLSFTALGENLFMCSGTGELTADFVVDSWMKSQGHRDNILEPNFTEMCIGIAKSGNDTFVAQLFAAGLS